MAAVKIVVIGASRVFAPTIVADLWHAREDLAGSTIALCDVDADTLDITTRVVQRMATERNMPYRIESSTARRDLLDGADYVIIAIALDHRRLWTIDLDIAERSGMVLTTGDTVGPGGWSRALRTVPVIQAIAEDMADLCPDAWLFNYTNPDVRHLPHPGQEHRPQGRGVVPRHRGNHATPGAVSGPSRRGRIRASRRHQPPAVDSRSALQRLGSLSGAEVRRSARRQPSAWT